MFLVRTALLVFAVLTLGIPANAAPLEAYGRLPSIESATLSPSGNSLAVITSNGEARTLVVKDLARGATRLGGFLGDYKIRDVQWVGEDDLIVMYSAKSNDLRFTNGDQEWFFASLIDLKTKKFRPLLRSLENGIPAIFGRPIVRIQNGEPTVFLKGMTLVAYRGTITLFHIDLDTAAARVVETGSDDTVDWALDAEGRIIGQEQYKRGTGRWALRVKTPEGWREAVSVVAPIDRPNMLGLGRDSGSVVYAIQEKGVWTVREVRTDGQLPAEAMTAPDASSIIREDMDGRIIGYSTMDGDQGRYKFFAEEDQHAWASASESFPDDTTALESWSADRKKVVVRVDSASNGPAYALIDLAARDAKWLGGQYAGLAPADISPRAAVRFRAADGPELSGYLTLPKGRAAKDLPLIVFPHGGPASRDRPGFDWWAQAMASRGYAVLQVNFRGSDGFGQRFLEAGYGEWGRKMQTDLSDGVRHLAGQGVIDPKRVCIIGASYGGYAALAGPTLDLGVYRCAVAVAGVSDPKGMALYGRERNGAPAFRYWKRFMGAQGIDDPRLLEISPLAHASAADAPILLIHGVDDTVVPIEQSRNMAEALKKAGKPVQFITMAGEDHWLSKGATRLQMLTAAVTFLEKHNPPN